MFQQVILVVVLFIFTKVRKISGIINDIKQVLAIKAFLNINTNNP